MNTSLTAYTHLESLLLFRSLSVYGLEQPTFSRISELLKNNPSITKDKSFQSGRLSPDALRNFVSLLLNEELEDEHRQDGAMDGEAQNGEVKNSRKRKAPGTRLLSVQEAARHPHLIPKLVRKLYMRYRTAIVHEIRDEEDRYERLQKELHSMERGDSDHKLVDRMNGRTSVPRSPSQPRKSPMMQHTPSLPTQSPRLPVQDGIPAWTPSSHAPKPPAATPSQPGISTPQSLPPVNGHLQSERTTKNAPGASPRRKQIASVVIPQPLTAPHAPPQQNHISPSHPLPPSPYARPQFATPGPTGPLPPVHKSPYPPAGPPPPLLPQIPQPTPSLASGHSPYPASPSHTPHLPPILPPGPHFPPQQIQAFGGNGVPQYGPPPGQPPQLSPTRQSFQGQSYGPPSAGAHTPQQQRSLSSHPPYPPFPPSPSHMSQPPSQGGIMLPPFQVSPQDPSRMHQLPPVPSQYPQVTTPMTRLPSSLKTDGSASISSRQALPPLQSPIFKRGGSLATPSSVRTSYSAMGTPRSAKSVWKSEAKSFVTRPTPRPSIEPIDDLPPTDLSRRASPKVKIARKSRPKGKGKEKEKEPAPEPEVEQPEDQVSEMETRRGRSLRKANARRTRPRSPTSSHAGRERTRSRSIISHTDTIAADNDSQMGTRVKTERGASVDVMEADPADTPSQPAIRRRGGAAQAGQLKGRKRTAREASLADSEDQPDLSQVSDLPKVVIAPRHFSRMCNPIMNDIGSHKHASTFTTAVKAKDAEGYYEIIKRPTDLKKIQKQIAVGAKAVSAAATDTPAGSPGGGGGIVELPVSADVMPPKAIVNSAQLEKELMRMFVNAVMFNTGEDGVVEDAREMFESCQRAVSNWRNAERSNNRMEVEIEETPTLTPGAEEVEREREREDVPTASKRRKL